MREQRAVIRSIAALALGAVVTATSGCVSTTSNPAIHTGVTSVATATPSHTSKPPSIPAAYGRSAASLAASVPGCSARPIAVASAVDDLPVRTLVQHVRSAAVCSLRGRAAELLTFPGPAAQAAIEAGLRGQVAYYAQGTGWLAIPVDLSEPVGQQSVVQDFALALRGKIVIDAAGDH